MDKKRLVQLCVRFQSGDKSAYEELYSTCYLPVYRFIYGITRRVEDTEDIVQETFLKVGKSIKSFKGGNALAWIYTIARNTMYDSFRRKRNIVEDDEILEYSATIEDKGNNEYDLTQLFNKLDLEERELIILKYWQGYSMKEIARIVGKKHDAIRQQMSRIIKKMRAKL